MRRSNLFSGLFSLGFRMLLVAAVATMALPGVARAADVFKVALVLAAGSGAPLFIGKEKGFFEAEGIDLQLVPIDTITAGAAAVASGGVDVAINNQSAGFFNIAVNQDFVIVAGMTYSKAGFSQSVIVASNAAYEKGFKSAKDMGGKRIGVASLGGGSQFTTILLAQKFGIPIESITLVAMGSDGNAVAAVKAGSIDAANTGAPVLALPLEKSGEGKIVAWTGDDAPTIAHIMFSSRKTASDRKDVFVRFFRGYLKAAKLYADTMTPANGPATLVRTPQVNELANIVAKYNSQKPDSIIETRPYILADGTFDPAEITRAFNIWQKAGLVDTKATNLNFVDLSAIQAAAK